MGERSRRNLPSNPPGNPEIAGASLTFRATCPDWKRTYRNTPIGIPSVEFGLVDYLTGLVIQKIELRGILWSCSMTVKTIGN